MKTKTATEARQLENWTTRQTNEKTLREKHTDEWQRQLDSKKDCREVEEAEAEAEEEVVVEEAMRSKLAKVMGIGHLWILKLIDEWKRR